jgi:hypothetical protein
MSAHRVVSAIVGAVLVLGLLAVGGLVFAAYYFSSRVHVTRSGTHGRDEIVRVDTPFGRVRVDKNRDMDPELLDMPLYPEAKVVNQGHSARVDLDLDFADKQLRIMAVEMETPDAFDKVVAFYRQAAPDYSFSQKAGGKVELLWQEGGRKKVIGIVERQGKTRIALANIGEPEGN